jgi:fructose-bisphosphate aldolase/2-amino-3,7-dideoxy-D-threo-hept-6-ulosonate synthase
MYTGVTARLERIGTDGRILNVPMDHGITIGATDGLEKIEATVDAVTAAGADSVLTQKGLATRVHPNKNGKGYIVHLNASTTMGPDANDKRMTGTVKEAVQAGADAVSLHLNVGSDHEPRQLEQLADVTREASVLGIPVLAMTYARGPGVDERDTESLAHAVRLGEEVGADVVKTAYSGDPESFRRVTAATDRPVIMAGGEPSTDRGKIENVHGAMAAGAAGVSMGRSIFQHEDPAAMTRAVSAIVHDNADIDEAYEKLTRAETPQHG